MSISEKLFQGLNEAGVEAAKRIAALPAEEDLPLNDDDAQDLYEILLATGGLAPAARAASMACLQSRHVADHQHCLLAGIVKTYVDHQVGDGLSCIRKSIALAPDRQTRLVHSTCLGCVGYHLGIIGVMEEGVAGAKTEARTLGVAQPLRTSMTQALFAATKAGPGAGVEEMKRHPIDAGKDPWGAAKWETLMGRFELQEAIGGRRLDERLVRSARTRLDRAAELQCAQTLASHVNFDAVTPDAPANAACRDFAAMLAGGSDAILTTNAFPWASVDFEDAGDEAACARRADIEDSLQDALPQNFDAALFHYGQLVKTGRVSVAEAADWHNRIASAYRPDVGDDLWRMIIGPSIAQLMAWQGWWLESAGDPGCLAYYKAAAERSERDPHIHGCVLDDICRAMRRFGLETGAAGVAALRDHEWSRVTLPRLLAYDDELLCDVRPGRAVGAPTPARCITTAHVAVYLRKRLREAAKSMIAGESALPHLEGEVLWAPGSDLKNLDNALVRTLQKIQPCMSSYDMAKVIGTSPSTIQRSQREL